MALITFIFISLLQSLAELTFDMVSPGPSHKSSLQPKNSASGVHPAELREGVANAYTVLTEVRELSCYQLSSGRVLTKRAVVFNKGIGAIHKGYWLTRGRGCLKIGYISLFLLRFYC